MKALAVTIIEKYNIKMIYEKSDENYRDKKVTTLGLVAARKDSLGIKGKNLIKIQNQEITKIALKLAIKCPAIDYVVLSTDSNKILNLIKENKKLIKLKRNKNLAKNNTPMLPVMKNAIAFFEKIKKKEISKLVIFDPTSPLRSMKDIRKAIKIFNKEKPDLLLSVHEGQHNPYFSMVEKKGKYFKLCKNHEKNPGARQQVPVVYEINTIVWIYSRKAIFLEGRRIPKKTLVFKTPMRRSIDIDTNYDMDRIYFYLNKNNKKI